MKEEMEARLGWLNDLLEDEKASVADKVDGLLSVLGEVCKEREHETKPMQAKIALEQTIIEVAAKPYNEAEAKIRNQLLNALAFVPDEKHKSDVGTAQIIRPKNRISYDTKGLETLRKSSDEVERMIGHLRSEKPRNPYLSVKLK